MTFYSAWVITINSFQLFTYFITGMGKLIGRFFRINYFKAKAFINRYVLMVIIRTNWTCPDILN